MKNSTLWRLLILVVVVTAVIEVLIITRWQLGVFDPRCLLLKGYIVRHTYTKERETIQCQSDTP